MSVRHIYKISPPKPSVQFLVSKYIYNTVPQMNIPLLSDPVTIGTKSTPQM